MSNRLFLFICIKMFIFYWLTKIVWKKKSNDQTVRSFSSTTLLFSNIIESDTKIVRHQFSIIYFVHWNSKIVYLLIFIWFFSSVWKSFKHYTLYWRNQHSISGNVEHPFDHNEWHMRRMSLSDAVERNVHFCILLFLNK
jgi:hypothetical protein